MIVRIGSNAAAVRRSASPPTAPAKPVVIAHPGRQHVYETVVAAQEGDLLQAFATGVYLGGQTPLSATVARARSAAPRSRLLRAAGNRSHPEIDHERVVSFLSYGLLARAVRGLPAGAQLERFVEWHCDAAIARWLTSLETAPRIVHGFEGGSLSTLRTARGLGATTVLDVPNAHEYVIAALNEEGDETNLRRVTERVQSERELAHILLAPSDFVVRCLTENGIARERIALVPYGVDPSGFAPKPRPTGGTFRVLFVGAVGLRKGIQYLLEAWSALNLPAAELLIVGGASAAGQRLLEKHTGAIRWLGQVARAEVHACFVASDVFAFPSLAEGSALVTYEAMATGLPVITTPNSGSVIRNGIDGLIVPPRDSQALAERMLLLHRDPDLRRELGLRARQTILEGYTWEHYRQRVRSVYDGVLRGHGPHQAPLIGTGR